MSLKTKMNTKTIAYVYLIISRVLSTWLSISISLTVAFNEEQKGLSHRPKCQMNTLGLTFHALSQYSSETKLLFLFTYAHVYYRKSQRFICGTQI